MFHPRIAKPKTESAVRPRDGRSQAPLRSSAQRRASLESGPGPERVRGPSIRPSQQPVPGALGDFSAVPIFSPTRHGQHSAWSPLTAPMVPGGLEPKLALGSVDDPLEHEADRVANQVMRTSAVASSIACDKAGASPGASADVPPPSVPGGLQRPAAQLSAEDSQFVEQHFGHDFTGVRIHTGAEAADSARALGARAYTVGNDVVFASGQYAPDTRDGQKLLAHELAHVIQQRKGLAQSIQRKPDDSPQPDAGSSRGAAAPPGAAVPGPDANEAAARDQDPDLARIDRKTQSPKENEDAVRAVVLRAFGSEEALNAAFDSLSPFVKDEVKDPGDRIQFFVRLRLYFDSWKDLLDHFSKENLVRVKRKFGGDVDVVLAKDAAAHLNRALDVLEKRRHPFPTISVGFSLRSYYKGDFMEYGYMIHAMGYAFDIKAARNPKIGYMPKPGAGTERLDPYLIAAGIVPAFGAMNMGDLAMNRSNIVEAMGKRTAAGKDEDLSAEEDKDPEARKYFERFKVQFYMMKAGSLWFVHTISEDRRSKLLDKRESYFKKLEEIKAEHEKEKKHGAKSAANPRVAQLEAEQRQLLAEIPPLVTEWITALDSEISKILKTHPGMDKMRPPAEISNDLKATRAELAKANAEEARTRAAYEKAMKNMDRALADTGSMDRQERAEIGIAAEEAKEIESTEILHLEGLMQRRDKLAAELKVSGDPKLELAWRWLTNYRELRRTLSGADLNTTAGRQKFERLMIGDLDRKAPPDNPPLLRLLDIGIFNPEGAFDLEFFEEMAHSGFVPGATWGFGGSDPMHFELQEGRNKIRHLHEP